MMATTWLFIARRYSSVGPQRTTSCARNRCGFLSRTGLSSLAIEAVLHRKRNVSSLRCISSSDPPKNPEFKKGTPLLSRGENYLSRRNEVGGMHSVGRSATVGVCRSRSTGSKGVKPMRSVLYTPGSSRHLYKLRDIACDASLIDLEDGVAPEAKVNAREMVCSEVAKGGYGRKAVVVRINSLDSPWGEEDIRAVAELTLDAVVLPKVESAADVCRVADLLRQHGSNNTDLWCMIETPLGVTRANEIASAHETVSCLVMGTSDLSRDLQANHTPDRTPLLYSLSRCILAARTHGLRCLDGVHLDMRDSEGFERACKQGRDMGMDGKTLIHPSTIPVANWFFGPNTSEVEHAYRVVKAHEDATAKGEGCAVLDGSLVERLHAENAWRIIELHESIAALEGHEDSADAEVDYRG